MNFQERLKVARQKKDEGGTGGETLKMTPEQRIQAEKGARKKKEREAEERRTAEIKKDERFKMMDELSRSVSIAEALDYIAIQHLEIDPTLEIGQITYSADFIPNRNEPVGKVTISRKIGLYDLQINVHLRKEATKYRTAFGGYIRERHTAVVSEDRQAGISIELFGLEPAYSLDEFLQTLARYLVDGNLPGKGKTRPERRASQDDDWKDPNPYL